MWVTFATTLVVFVTAVIGLITVVVPIKRPPKPMLIRVEDHKADPSDPGSTPPTRPPGSAGVEVVHATVGVAHSGIVYARSMYPDVAWEAA